MYNPPGGQLPASLHKVDSNSRLTFDINQATLPAVPSLVPPPPMPNISRGDIHSVISGPQSVAAPSFSDNLPPFPSPMPPQPTEFTSRPAGQKRSRYVLPPQMAQSAGPSVPLPPPTAENLSQPSQSPTPAVSQVESGFSTMTVLPTPLDYISSSTTQETTQPAEQQALVPKATYELIAAHWFYSTKTTAHGIIWWPFDVLDNQKLEAAAKSANLLSVEGFSANTPSATVPVRGGLYDVLLRERVYKPAYWPSDEEESGEVRRVTWLYHPQNEQRVLPFSEAMCQTLEERYREALEKNTWGERFTLPSEESPKETNIYVFHNEKTMLQYRNTTSRDSPSGFDDCAYLYRGLREDLASQLPQGDDRPIEHVVFVVHGIGTVYNMRGEGLVSCVNHMRKTAAGLLDSHFKTGDHSRGRVEFLPVRWHSSLHSEATGVNNRIRRVTLRSIPKLRGYTNDTLMDVLFYASPKYCQHIMDTVVASIKHLKDVFLQRNPDFRGDFSIAGHSLGSVIVFDLLSHQRRSTSGTPSLKSSNGGNGGGGGEEDEWSLLDAATPTKNSPDLAAQLASVTDLSEAQIQHVVNLVGGGANAQSTVGIGLPVVNYPQLGFPLNTCFLLGSPLSAFLIARGIERLPSEFRLPTCQACVNIFHPFDPVAYRLENLIVPDYRPCAVLMPHHKGRKRLHLELKDNIARVGADISSRVYQSLRSTWRTLQEFASAHTSAGASKSTEDAKAEDEEESEAIKRVLSRITDGARGDDEAVEEEEDTDTFPSQLNQGRRLDFVLQEGPLESLNDYLFALSSHAVYWESQDCLLFMLTQIFTNSSNGNGTPVGGGGGGAASAFSQHRPPSAPRLMAPQPGTMAHSATISGFSNQGPSAAQQSMYPPSQTPIYNSSPVPSSTSLQSQGIDRRGSQSTSDLIDLAMSSEKDPNLVEIDLAP